MATLRSLECIRSRCKVIYEAAKADQLAHFRLDLSKLDDVAAFVQGKIRSSPTFNVFIFIGPILLDCRSHQRASVLFESHLQWSCCGMKCGLFIFPHSPPRSLHCTALPSFSRPSRAKKGTDTIFAGAISSAEHLLRSKTTVERRW